MGKTHNESICGGTQTEGDGEERSKKKGDPVQTLKQREIVRTL